MVSLYMASLIFFFIFFYAIFLISSFFIFFFDAIDQWEFWIRRSEIFVYYQTKWIFLKLEEKTLRSQIVAPVRIVWPSLFSYSKIITKEMSCLTFNIAFRNWPWELWWSSQTVVYGTNRCCFSIFLFCTWTLNFFWV